MSTGLNCELYETERGWYYLLQDWSCPVGAWDWREYARAYGPFTSEEKAFEHLRENHANPGGSATYRLGEYQLDKPLVDALAKATAKGE